MHNSDTRASGGALLSSSPPGDPADAPAPVPGQSATDDVPESVSSATSAEAGVRTADRPFAVKVPRIATEQSIMLLTIVAILLTDEAWPDLILGGVKAMELRSRATLTGPTCFGHDGHIYSSAEITECNGISETDIHDIDTEAACADFRGATDCG